MNRTPRPGCRDSLHVSASFEFDHCGADTPVRDAQRGRLAPEGWPAVELDLCPACYQDALADGILDQP